ncbi:hypothetical protein U1Q18_033118 [Sarracenia purpurea var. burkii]
MKVIPGPRDSKALDEATSSKQSLLSRSPPQRHKLIGSLEGITMANGHYRFARNRTVHLGLEIQALSLVESVRKTFSDHKEAWEEVRPQPKALWFPPQEGVPKVNFDVEKFFGVSGYVQKCSRGYSSADWAV